MEVWDAQVTVFPTLIVRNWGSDKPSDNQVFRKWKIVIGLLILTAVLDSEL